MLHKPEYRQQIAEALLRGIRAYSVAAEVPRSASAEEPRRHS
jgi:hypothetical protein